jgi:hypothetical protein
MTRDIDPVGNPKPVDVCPGGRTNPDPFFTRARSMTGADRQSELEEISKAHMNGGK